MLIHPLILRCSRRALSLALIGAMTTGCTTTTLIPVTQAPRLAVNALSFRDELRAVRNVDGQLVVIGESFTAHVEMAPNLPGGWAPWSGTEAVIKSPFMVEMRPTTLMLQRAYERPVEVPLAYVKQIRVRELSVGNTVGLVLGLVAGAGLVAFAVTGAALGRMQ
jgi:hypothetical protein